MKLSISKKLLKSVMDTIIASAIVLAIYLVYLVLVGIPATQDRVRSLGEKPGNYFILN